MYFMPHILYYNFIKFYANFCFTVYNAPNSADFADASLLLAKKLNEAC